MVVKNYCFDHFLKAGCTREGAAAVCGNIQAESGFIPINLQDSCNSSLGMSDAAYTAAVDNGSYGRFAYDQAGYGLVQFTHPSRKSGFLSYAKSRRKSIGDVDTQLEYIVTEMKRDYVSLWGRLCSEHDVGTLTRLVMVLYEAPYDQSERAKQTRIGYASAILEEMEDREEIPAESTPVGYLMRNIQLPELCFGTRGEPIRSMQALLCVRGCVTAVDGIFGSNTKNALIEFQTAHDLAADGICGKDTWTKLIGG